MTDIQLYDSMQDMLIKQPYSITMARHQLSTGEMRIMMRILEALQPKMTYSQEQKRYAYPYEIRKTIFGDTEIFLRAASLLPKGSKNYANLRKALRGMVKKSISITIKHEDGEEEEIFTNIVMRATFKKRANMVSLQIPKEIIPEMLGLANNYTKYLLNVAFNSSSTNTMKLYQYVSHWRDKKQIFWKIESLRHWLNIEDKYKKPYEIEKWIFKPAIEELKRQADVWFEVAEKVKEGRNILGWKLNIFTKKNKMPALAQVSSSVNDRLLKKLVDTHKLSHKQAVKAINHIDHGNLNKALYAIMLNKNKIDNIGAYTVTCINKQFGIKL